ncbi:fungal hydrophobin [Phanerochaete sordida]|uniref:Hydrophobin n=1 Tax=Phanerochaete sordida TaxID=48140 RepID=A0A9P3LI86_9APHY|nr:fungal hydrophobin [Phanerochaete sordida]
MLVRTTTLLGVLCTISSLAAATPTPTQPLAERQLLPPIVSSILGILPSSLPPLLPSSIGLPGLPSLSLPGLPLPTGGTDTCTTGSPQCCQTVQPSSSLPADLLSQILTDLSALGLSPLAPDATIGLQCIADIAGCISNPVCCSNEANVTQIGLVNLNCVSIL